MKETLSKQEMRIYETRLRLLVDELTKELRQIQGDALGATGEVHSNRGDEATEEAALVPELGILSGVQQQLKSAREALVRLASGSFGICATCGQAIPRGRLDLIPFANECIECARRTERNDLRHH